jgi:hypothetical protein
MVSGAQNHWVIQRDVGGVVSDQKSDLEERRKVEIVLSSSFVEKQVLMARGDWSVNGNQEMLTMRCL